MVLPRYRQYRTNTVSIPYIYIYIYIYIHDLYVQKIKLYFEKISRYVDKAATRCWLKWVGQNQFLVITWLSCHRIGWNSQDWYSFFAADLTVCLTALGDQLESEIWKSESGPSPRFCRNKSKKSKFQTCWKLLKMDFKCINMHIKYGKMHINA